MESSRSLRGSREAEKGDVSEGEKRSKERLRLTSQDLDDKCTEKKGS